jgi:hypothetical protein
MYFLGNGVIISFFIKQLNYVFSATQVRERQIGGSLCLLNLGSDHRLFEASVAVFARTNEKTAEPSDRAV